MVKKKMEELKKMLVFLQITLQFFSITGAHFNLPGHSQADLKITIIEQAKKYQPKAVVIVNDSHVEDIQNALEKENIEILFGRDGLLEISKRDDVDLVMNGLVGSAGMEPTINSLKAGVDVALSNKESMVMAGDLINNIILESGAKIYPVDSEHSAIWQCLVGENIEDVKRIILTGSGGPFRTRDVNTFSEISLKA